MSLFMVNYISVCYTEYTNSKTAVSYRNLCHKFWQLKFIKLKKKRIKLATGRDFATWQYVTFRLTPVKCLSLCRQLLLLCMNTSGQVSSSRP